MVNLIVYVETRLTGHKGIMHDRHLKGLLAVFGWDMKKLGILSLNSENNRSNLDIAANAAITIIHIANFAVWRKLWPC